MIIVETGAGTVGANAYIGADEADDFAADLLIADWPGRAPEDRQRALIYAARWLDREYQWRGTRNTTSQGLGWPRNILGEPALGLDGQRLEGVPFGLKVANVIAANLQLTGALEASTAPIRLVKAGSVEVEYARGAPPSRDAYAALDRELRGIGWRVSADSASVRLAKA